jgi:hypothetical protein
MSARVQGMIVRAVLTINRGTLASVVISRVRGVSADQTTVPVTVRVPVNPSVIISRGATNRAVIAREVINPAAISLQASRLANRPERPLPSRPPSLPVRSLASTAAPGVMVVSAAAAAKTVFVRNR